MQTSSSRAFILINTELGKEREVATQLSTLDIVKEVHTVYGIYDMIAFLEADSLDTLKQTISSKLRRIEGIHSTLTMIVV